MSNSEAYSTKTAAKVAFSIPEFCARNGISAPTYYKMRAQGRGPNEMRFGSAVRISLAEEAAWQHARSHPSDEERAMIATERVALKRRSDAAVARAPHVAEARREA